MGAMPISGRRSRGEDGRPLRLRTPAIRRNRPTVQGPPAFSPAQCPRAGCRPILPQRTSGVMLKTTRVHASIWSRTLFQNAVFKLSHGASAYLHPQSQRIPCRLHQPESVSYDLRLIRPGYLAWATSGSLSRVSVDRHLGCDSAGRRLAQDRQGSRNSDDPPHAPWFVSPAHDTSAYPRPQPSGSPCDPFSRRSYHTNRIRGLLALHGIREVKGLWGGPWAQALAALRTGDGRGLGGYLRAELAREFERLTLSCNV